MEVLKRAAALALLGTLGGCGFTRAPTAVEDTGEQITVHAVLVAGAAQASVLLLRVTPGREAATPVTGATVRIAAGGEEVPLTEGGVACRSPRDAPPTAPAVTAGCYGAAVPGGVRPGARYLLRIRTSEGHAIEGTTTVPAGFRIAEVASGERMRIPGSSADADTPAAIVLRLLGSEGIASASARITPTAVFERGRVVAAAECNFTYPDPDYFPPERLNGADSVRFVIRGVDCTERTSNALRSVAPDSIRVRLSLSGYDAAYTAYSMLLGVDVARRDRASVGITGAFGLFAGAARDERTLTLVPCRSSGPCAAR